MNLIPYALLFGAVGLAWALEARRPAHRPAALALTGLLASELVQLASDAATKSAARPYAGAARIAFHAGQAAFLAYPAVTCALVVALFTRRSPWTVTKLWTVLVVGVATSYPALRGSDLGHAYAAAQAIACAACLGLLRRVRVDTLTATESVAVALSVAVGGTLVGAYLSPDPFASWTLPRVAYVLAYGSILAVQGSALWSLRR